MRTALVVVLATLSGCNAESRPGPPVRLVAGAGSDTVVVNGRRPMPLPVRALDARGRSIVGAPIRYALDAGQDLQLTSTGEVSCAHAGDYFVRAAVAAVNTRLTVRCRPIDHLRIPGPLQFVLGDSVLGTPRDVPLHAFGADGKPVALIAGSVGIMDSTIASLSGLTMTPRIPGASLAWANVGEQEARIGVHVYRRVGGPDALDTVTRIVSQQRLIAVPFRLAAGELRRARLPPGAWMLSMLPEEARDSARVRLRVEGAACHPTLTPRRFICGSRQGASLVIYRSVEPADPMAATGDLLVRWLGEM